MIHLFVGLILNFRQPPYNFTGQGFDRMNRSIGTDFSAAVTADTTVIIKNHLASLKGYGLDGTVLPAFRAALAKRVIHNRSLDQMPAYDPLQHAGAECHRP